MLTIHQKKDRHKPMVQYARLGKIGAEAYAQLAAGKKKCALLCMDTKGTPMTNVAYWFGPAMRAARNGSGIAPPRALRTVATVALPLEPIGRSR